MSDTAEYSAVATNQHGTATSKATVTVKSKSFSSSPYRPFTSHVSVCNRDFLFPHRTSRSRRVLPAWFRWGQTGAVAEGPGGGWDVFFSFLDMTRSTTQDHLATNSRACERPDEQGNYCKKLLPSSRNENKQEEVLLKSWSNTAKNFPFCPQTLLYNIKFSFHYFIL